MGFGWHHYKSQTLLLCQNCILIITPQTKQCFQKLTAQPPSGGKMPRTSQGQLAERCRNASRGHQTANCHPEPPIHTASLPNGLFNETIKCKWDLSCDSWALRQGIWLQSVWGWIFHLDNFPFKSRHNTCLQSDLCGKHRLMLLHIDKHCVTLTLIDDSQPSWSIARCITY